MAEPPPTSPPQSVDAGPDLHPRTKVNASRGLHKPAKPWKAKIAEIRQGKEDYERRRAKRLEQLEERTGPDLEYLKEREKGESVLEVQAILLRQLAAEENQLKGLCGQTGLSATEFNKRLKEVEEALRPVRN